VFKRSDIVAAALACIGAIIYTCFFFDRGLDLFDEGLYATEAWRVLEGGAYGNDFLAPYGPGRYYLIAGLFALFGASLKVQAGLFLVLRGFVAALFYIVSRRVLPRGMSLVMAAAVTLAHGALHKSFFQFVVLANIAAWFAYRRSRTARACFAAGMVCGVTTLFRVDAGIFAAVSCVTLLALELVWDKPAASIGAFGRKAGGFLVGAALPLVPVALAVLLAGDLEMVLRSEIQRTVNLVRFADAVTVPGLGQALESHSLKRILLSLMIPAAPVALIALGLMALLFRIRGDSGAGTLEVLAVAVFGLPVMNQLRITPTFNHLLQSVPLALLAATVIVCRLAGRARSDGPPEPAAKSVRVARATSLARAAVKVVAIVPAAILVFYSLALTKPDARVPGSIRIREAFDTAIPLEGAGLYEKAENASELKRVVAAILAETDPSDTIMTGPYSPALHFLSRRMPAVPFLEPFYYFDAPRGQMEMIEALERKRPALVVLGGPVQSVGGQTLARDAPILEHYISLRYRPHGVVGRYRIFKRID